MINFQKTLNLFIQPLNLFKVFNNVHYAKHGTFASNSSVIFDVVKQTGKYSQFIPWCSRSVITKKIQKNQNFTQLTISFNKLKQLSYLSHVKIFGQNISDSRYKIQSICKDQPLKKLISIWEIQKHSKIDDQGVERTHVNYSIQYQFDSPLLQLTSNWFLNYVGESMWIIFKDQSQKIYKQASSEQSKSNLQNQSAFKIKYKHQTSLFHQKTLTNQKSAISLIEYLNKNQQIHQIYLKNNDFRIKVDEWSKILSGTCDFEAKLQFKIKNYFISKG